jgi:hypothetical protein
MCSLIVRQLHWKEFVGLLAKCANKGGGIKLDKSTHESAWNALDERQWALFCLDQFYSIEYNTPQALHQKLTSIAYRKQLSLFQEVSTCSSLHRCVGADWGGHVYTPLWGIVRWEGDGWRIRWTVYYVWYGALVSSLITTCSCARRSISEACVDILKPFFFNDRDIYTVTSCGKSTMQSATGTCRQSYYYYYSTFTMPELRYFHWLWWDGIE